MILESAQEIFIAYEPSHSLNMHLQLSGGEGGGGVDFDQKPYQHPYQQ